METPVESGTLSALAQERSPDATPFQQRKNLIADFFTQVASRETDATQRPLVVMKDFFSRWIAEPKTIEAFLPEGLIPSAKHAGLIAAFQGAVNHWKGTFDANLVRGKNPAFYFKDLMQFLIRDREDGTLTLDENVTTAMSYAAFSWIAENAMRSRYNTDAEINAILGRDEDAEVSRHEHQKLGLVGARQNVVVNALGQRAVQALGLKPVKGAPQNLLPQLESAIGAHIMKMMLDQGILVRTTLSAKEMADLTGQAEQDVAPGQFLAVARNAQGELNAQAQRMRDTISGTGGFLDTLFSVEPGLKEPSFTPIPFNQKTAKNTNQAVPEALAKIIAHENAVPSFVRQDMWALLEQLDESVALEMAGVVDVSETTTHAAKVDSLHAKNDALRLEYERFVEYVRDTLMTTETQLETPLYFDHVVWKQQRVGIATNVINPQSSKLHRFLMYRKAWETKVDTADAVQMENFKLRVMEGLGVKTDKQGNERSLSGFDAMFDPELNTTDKDRVAADARSKAVDVLVQTVIHGEEMTPALQQTLLAGVKAGGEKFHSLDALMAMAHYRAHGDATTFTVQMMGEVDGVTNGPMLSHLLLGAAPTANALFERLNKGGFFQEGNAHAQYNLWREAAGNLDLYETTSLHMTQAAEQRLRLTPGLRPLFAAVYGITGSLVNEAGKITKEGRNIIKTPLTAMVFGSTTQRAVESMAENFVESIYDKFEAVVAGKADQAEVLGYVNTLLGAPSLQIPSKTTGLELLQVEFNRAQLDAIKTAFTDTLGQAVETTMEQDFAVFMAQRKQLNKAAQLTFELYNAVYTALRDAFIAEEAQAGRIAADKNGKPYHDLTLAQEAELRARVKALMPVVHTTMSKESGTLSAGLHMSKTGRKLSTQSAYQGEIHFGTPFADNGAKSTKANSYQTLAEGPGVAMVPMLTHATDSAISHHAADGNEVLNVHDAHGAGLATFAQTARNLNRATWEAMLAYSPASEIYAALERTVNGLAQYLAQDNVPETVIVNLRRVLAKAATRKQHPKDVIAAMINATKDAAYQADSIKLDVLSQLASVDQYALQGGNYEVTPENRKTAAEQRGELSPEVAPATLTSVATLLARLGETGATPVTETAQEAESTAPVLQISPARAMQLLEHGAQDESLPAGLRAQMQQVREAMWKTQQTLQQSVKSVLNDRDAAAVVEHLSARFAALPADQWGERGTPTIESDPELVALFEQRGGFTAAQTLQVLKAKLERTSAPNLREFNLRLLAALAKTVDQNLRVRYVTPATAPELVLDRGAERSRGWYVNNGEKGEIYVLSPDFAYSGLTAETLLHELVHAAVASTIETATGDAKALVEELEVLRDKAQTYVNGLSTAQQSQFAPALVNVQELVAWGMSNLDFQKNVLGKITMHSGTRGNALVTGMKKFIDALVGLLFRNTSKSEAEVLSNGMSVLIGNVSGLFHAAAQNGPQVRMNLSQQAPDPIADAKALTTVQLFDALDAGAVEPGFAEHLRGLLTGIAGKLHGPFGTFKALAEANVGLSPLDLFQRAQDTGVAPFASKILASGFPMNDQVAFVLEQVEATVRTALENNESQTSVAYNELSRLYMEAYRSLKVEHFHDGDWAAATPTEKANAQALYDFVFKIEAANGDKSDYLARFAALGLAHPQVNALLGFNTTSRARTLADGKTIAEKLEILFEKVLNLLHGRLTKTFDGQRADAKLETLVNQLVGIEAKKRRKLAVDKTSALYNVEEGMRKFAEGVRSKVGDVAGAEFFRKHRFPVVRAVSGIAEVIAKDRVEMVVEKLTEIRNKHVEAKNGFVAGMVNELRGLPAQFQALLRWAKSNERQRKFLITEVGKTVLESFANQGQDLTKAQKAALSAVFLRTDAQVLLDSHGVEGLERLLGSRTELAKAIQDVEHQLAQFSAYQHFYVKSAKLLAHYKVTGAVKGEHLLMNAHNIARLAGTPFKGRVSEENAAKAEVLIDQLVTLRALQGTGAAHKTEAMAVLAAERARTDGGNGVEMILGLHRKLQQDSQARLFQDAEALRMKGYVSEIYNPHTEIVIADAAKGKELEALGYVKGAPVGLDPNDPNTAPKHHYVLKDGGLNRYLTGAFSITGQHAKGSRTQDANMAELPDVATVSVVMSRKQAAIRKMFDPDPTFDPDRVKATFMAPIVNAAGDVSNYRYLMLEATKDAVLERDNRFEKILGTIAGSIFDKESAVVQNQAAVQALRDQYQAEFKLKPEAYVEVGPASTDPELREIYRLLPDHTKQAVRRIWGREGMRVRVDLLNVNFGYRKLSAADPFEKVGRGEEDPEGKGTRTQIEDAYVRFVEKLLETYAAGVNIHRQWAGKAKLDPKTYAKRAGMVVRRNERIWQELVHELKDLIVVKTGTVLVGNILSNVSLLAMSGVGLKEIVHHHRVAIRGARAYQKDNAKLLHLETQRDSGYVTGTALKAVEHEIVVLKDALARNPVHTLIEAGLMPTIVEDVEADDDLYSYKSQFVRRMDRYTSKLNENVVKVGRAVYMAHDTKLYKGLAHWTQLSDFVARYTLYQHLTTRKQDPMASDAAIQEASDAFVNYDIPMPKGMQYLDDMGVVMFTKYFMRIQRVLLKLTREHPTRVLAHLLLNHYVDVLPMVTDSSMLARLGNNPFEIGALQLPASLDELATVNAGLSLFR